MVFFLWLLKSHIFKLFKTLFAVIVSIKPQTLFHIHLPSLTSIFTLLFWYHLQNFPDIYVAKIWCFSNYWSYNCGYWDIPNQWLSIEKSAEDKWLFPTIIMQLIDCYLSIVIIQFFTKIVLVFIHRLLFI